MLRRVGILKLLVLSGLMLVLVACGGEQSPTAATEETIPAGFEKNGAGYADITVEQLAEMLPDKDFTLVNVHIPFEGDLPQTDAFVPFNEIEAHLDRLPAKDAPIVLYCRSGNMSTQAAEELADLGYTNVMELDGGFNAWKASGRELVGQ